MTGGDCGWLENRRRRFDDVGVGDRGLQSFDFLGMLAGLQMIIEVRMIVEVVLAESAEEYPGGFGSIGGGLRFWSLEDFGDAGDLGDMCRGGMVSLEVGPSLKCPATRLALEALLCNSFVPCFLVCRVSLLRVQGLLRIVGVHHSFPSRIILKLALEIQFLLSSLTFRFSTGVGTPLAGGGKMSTRGRQQQRATTW